MARVDNIQVNLRHASDIPMLRYIVPFSYAHHGVSYEDAKQRMIESPDWTIGKRKDLVPSGEEDLYDHVYRSLIDNKKTSIQDTNVGMFFVPLRSEPKKMVYSFFDSEMKKYIFYISDVGIYLFKSGIGFYVYEAKLPCNENTEEGFISQLSIDELIIFQNRFKELNVVRGYYGKGANKYYIYPYGNEQKEFYTLGSVIAYKLQNLLSDVFYYPPRVNVVLQNKMTHKYKNEKKREQDKKEKKGEQDTNEKNEKKTINRRLKFWNNVTVDEIVRVNDSEIDELGNQDHTLKIRVVPDKAILYSYVVMNTDQEMLESDNKEVAINKYCQNAYYLTRGYKPSYRVSDHVIVEREQMFQRHGNDFWDASLEGAGDFVLIYDNLYVGDKQKTNLFFDSIRPKEMRGDYFILFILLLYQHYTIVYYSRKISETIPMQAELFVGDSRDRKGIYDRLRKLKIDVDMFFANSMYEAVGQITDVCTIYSFIEGKMQIRRNIEMLKMGIGNLDSLREEILEKEKEEKERKISHIVTIVGLLAIISILLDAMQLIEWLRTGWIQEILKVVNG